MATFLSILTFITVLLLLSPSGKDKGLGLLFALVLGCLFLNHTGLGWIKDLIAGIAWMSVFYIAILTIGPFMFLKKIIG